MPAAFTTGRDIYFDQRYAHALEMRDVLEAIVGDLPNAGRRARHRSKPPTRYP